MAKQEQTNQVVVFGTVEEARAAKPADRPKWRLWRVVSPAGQERYLWADGIGHALKQIAQADGYQAVNLDSKPMNPAAVAGILAAMSPEDRAILIAQYVPAGPATPAPGKGKGGK
jgi:hypothetical protein